MEGIKGERSEQQSDRVENHHQHGLDLGGFEVQKVRFFIKKYLGRSSKLCFLLGGKHIDIKTGENDRRKMKIESEERSMASLMPICAGLLGPRSENVKISSALVRPKWACKQQTHVSAAYFACPKKALVRREREPKRQRSDRSEKGLQKRVYPTLFDAEKVNFLLQNASYRF